MNERREIPDDEDGNPFLSIGDFIQYGNVSIASLATAIETCGIYSWDQYGRFKRFGADTEQGKLVLRMLAAVYEYQHNPEPNFRANTQHPLDQCAGDWDDPFYRFGWTSEVAPDFDAIKAGQLEAKKPAKQDPRKETAYLNIIGVLLEYIEGSAPGVCKHPAYNGISELAEYIDDRYKGYYGVSASNLSRKFPEAKRALGKG